MGTGRLTTPGVAGSEGRRLGSIDRSAESSVPAKVEVDCSPQVSPGEVRPQGVEEYVLRVCRLPEEEVRCALFAAGPNEKVHVRHLRLVEPTRNELLAHRRGTQPARGDIVGDHTVIFAANGEGITVRDVATSTGIDITTNGTVTALTAGKDGIDAQSQSLTGNITIIANGDVNAGNAGIVGAIFPVIINTYAGIKDVRGAMLDIGRVYCASPSQIFWKITLPASMPYILAGIRLSVGLAIIGMVVAEFFTAVTGLGGLIVFFANSFATAKLFVPIIVIGLLGVFTSEAISILERRLLAWRDSEKRRN